MKTVFFEKKLHFILEHNTRSLLEAGANYMLMVGITPSRHQPYPVHWLR